MMKVKSKNQIPLTQKKLKELLHYDPETGVFTWRIYRNHHTATGDIAGTVQWFDRRKYMRSFKKKLYRNIKVFGCTYRASHLAFLYMTGKWPPNQIDHINCNSLDNRWVNLRPCTQLQNNRNRQYSPRSTSFFKGVYFHKKHKKYRAQISVNRKTLHLGCFFSQTDAACAYDRAAKKYYGEFANLNFPSE